VVNRGRARPGRRLAPAVAAVAAMVWAACAATAPPVPATRAPTLELRWQHEPDGAGGTFAVAVEGSGELVTWSQPEHADGAPRAHLAAHAGRGTLVAAWSPPRAPVLPRWSHTSGTANGLRLVVVRDGGEVHRSFGAIAPGIADLAQALAATDPRLAAALAPMSQSAPVAGTTFTFSPGDDPERLAAVLLGPPRDLLLRHLAARIAIAIGAAPLVPRLHDAFVRSRAADGVGDYYLAAVLLRSGDPIGVGRVCDVLTSSRPQWQAEAAADLSASLPDELGADLQGEWAGNDHVRARLSAWFGPDGANVEFDRQTARYRAIVR
jgi:hypothetical protein